jgi:hypothetical protein
MKSVVEIRQKVNEKMAGAARIERENLWPLINADERRLKTKT